MITQWRQEVRVEEGSIQCTERERRRAWRVQAVQATHGPAYCTAMRCQPLYQREGLQRMRQPAQA